MSEEYGEFTRKTILLFTVAGIFMIVIMLALTSGCVTASKKLINDVSSTPTPTPTPTPVPTYFTPTPEPTLAPKEYSLTADEFSEGLRKIDIPYRISRQNVSGYKDISVNYRVYKYLILHDGYGWYAGSLGQYLYNPAKEGKDFLIIFVRAQPEDSSDRIFLPDSSHFVVQIGDTQIKEDTDYQKNIRIKELEEVYNYNNDDRVKPYGYEWAYDPNFGNNDYTTYEGEYSMHNGGWVAYKRLWLRCGKSNAEDGYIIYEIPEEHIDPIIIAANLNLGSAAWQLE